MKKAGKVAIVLALIGMIYFLRDWSCKRSGKYEHDGITNEGELVVEPPEQPTDPDNTRQFTIVYSSNLNAEYDNCGCKAQPLGGLAKKATVVAKLKSEGNPLILVDGGDMLFQNYQNSPEVWNILRKRAELIVDLQKKIGIDAVNVGDQDLATGLKYLELLEAKGFPFVSANLRRANGMPSSIPTYRILDVNGLKIGVFGLLSNQLGYKTPNIPNPDFEVLDPFEEAKIVVEELKSKNIDIIIALSNLGFDGSTKLAQQIPEIDFIINGHDNRLLDKAEKVGNTFIFQALNRGMYLGVMHVVVIPDKFTFVDGAEREALYTEMVVLSAQTRVFQGEIANLEEVRQRLKQISERTEKIKERAKEFLVPLSRFDNSIVVLDDEIVPDPEIQKVVNVYKAGGNQ